MVKALNNFYAVMGNFPEAVGALNAMAGALLEEKVTLDQLEHSLKLCRRECRFPVRLPDIFLRIPGCEVPRAESEARAGWDMAIQFTEKYVGNDIHGNYGPEHGWYCAIVINGEVRRPATYPQLPQKILDIVRRTGGWKQYKRMTDEDQPFLQKRFFEEYKSWTAVERIADPSRILPMPSQKQKQLAAPSTIEELPKAELAKPKRIENPPTIDQLRDRAAVEKARLEQWAKARQAAVVEKRVGE